MVSLARRQSAILTFKSYKFVHTIDTFEDQMINHNHWIQNELDKIEITPASMSLRTIKGYTKTVDCKESQPLHNIEQQSA